MTINSEIRKVGPFIGNGTATAFPFTFKVFQASDLEVVRLEVSTNVETVLTLNSQYTVTLNVDQDSNPGGTVTLIGGALASGYTLTLTSDVPYLQPTDLTNQGGFYPDVINDALDRATIQIQQLGVDINRSIKVAVSSDVNTELPVPNANDLLGWDSTGTSLTNVDPSTIATVVAYATAYADVFVGDGVTTSFVLTRNPAVLYNLDVSIQGVTQEPVRDYTLSGTTITFTTAPFDTHRVLVKYKEGLPNYEGDSQDVRYVPSGTGAVATTVQSKLRETVSVKDFGAVGDGVADDTVAIENAIAAAATSVNGSTGATVYFPTGTYLISNTIAMPNRVALVGNGDYAGVTIKPHSTFTGNYMFHASNGTSSMFGSYIKNFYIDARGFTMIAPVYSQAWQETCGLVNVLIQFDGLTQYGMLYSNGYGGAAYLRLQETQIFADSTQSNAAGILVTQVSSVGGFVLDFQNGTIAGSVANPLPSGIRMENDSLRVHTYHAEYVTNMVTMSGVGSLSADTLTGSFNAVTNMVTISSTFTGKASLRNMIPNGTTGEIFNDVVSGRSISHTVGMLPSFDYEPSAFSAVVSAQINNVTGNGTEYPIVFDSETYDYLGEYNVSNGAFTAQKTGKYIFTTQVEIAVTAGVTTCALRISTSNRDYYIYRGDTDNIYSGAGQITFNGSCIADLDAGDTARVTIVISGLGGDTVDILPNETRFSGQWLSR